MTSNYGDNLTSLYQTKLLLQVSENKKKKLQYEKVVINLRSICQPQNNYRNVILHGILKSFTIFFSFIRIT